MGSYFSRAKPNGSMRTWQTAQLAALTCFSTCCRIVSLSSPPSSSGSCGTFAGGRGSFSPSSVSTTQLPRSTGLVRDAPDCLACTLARPRMPPRPYFRTPSTRRHCGPVTPGMP